jgi:hypothetical protein
MGKVGSMKKDKRLEQKSSNKSKERKKEKWSDQKLLVRNLLGLKTPKPRGSKPNKIPRPKGLSQDGNNLSERYGLDSK